MAATSCWCPGGALMTGRLAASGTSAAMACLAASWVARAGLVAAGKRDRQRFRSTLHALEARPACWRRAAHPARDRRAGAPDRLWVEPLLDPQDGSVLGPLTERGPRFRDRSAHEPLLQPWFTAPFGAEAPNALAFWRRLSRSAEAGLAGRMWGSSLPSKGGRSGLSAQ